MRSNHAVTRGLHIGMSQKTSWCSQASLRLALQFLRCDGLGFACNKGSVVPDWDLYILSPLREIHERCLDLKTLGVQVNILQNVQSIKQLKPGRLNFLFPF